MKTGQVLYKSLIEIKNKLESSDVSIRIKVPEFYGSIVTNLIKGGMHELREHHSRLFIRAEIKDNATYIEIMQSPDQKHVLTKKILLAGIANFIQKFIQAWSRSIISINEIADPEKTCIDYSNFVVYENRLLHLFEEDSTVFMNGLLNARDYQVYLKYEYAQKKEYLIGEEQNIQAFLQQIANDLSLNQSPSPLKKLCIQPLQFNSIFYHAQLPCELNEELAYLSITAEADLEKFVDKIALFMIPTNLPFAMVNFNKTYAGSSDIFSTDDPRFLTDIPFCRLNPSSELKIGILNYTDSRDTPYGIAECTRAGKLTFLVHKGESSLHLELNLLEFFGLQLRLPSKNELEQIKKLVTNKYSSLLSKNFRQWFLEVLKEEQSALLNKIDDQLKALENTAYFKAS